MGKTTVTIHWSRFLAVLSAPSTALVIALLGAYLQIPVLIPIAIAPIAIRYRLAGAPVEAETFLGGALGALGLQRDQVSRLAKGVSISPDRAYWLSLISWLPLACGFVLFLAKVIANGIVGS